MESPKIIGLKCIHYSDTFHCWGGLTFCPWCRKEGQNEGTVVIHLRTTHYHLGLICTQCHKYFTTNVEAMHHHPHGCDPSATGDDDNSEEDDSDNDGKEDEGYIVNKD